jgi:hypothetical protein
MTRSLGAQISSVRHCIAVAQRECAPEIIANAEAGLKSLEWIDKHHDVIRVVFEILKEFPGARVVPNG